MSKTHKTVILSMLTGLLIILITLIFAYITPIQLPLPKEIIFCMSLLLPTLCYIIGILRVAMLRLKTNNMINPLESNNNEKFLIAKQYLSNTTEQLLFATITYYLICFSLPYYLIYISIVLSVYFFIGRILFMLGYKKLFVRILGFTLTFHSNVLAFLGVFGFYCTYFYFLISQIFFS
jgi:hypothetical protein